MGEDAVSAQAVPGPEVAQYDAVVKRLLSQRGILARIMLRCMRELDGLTVGEVEARIEGTPQVGEVPVGPSLPSAVAATSVEDSVPGEGRVTYDIRATVRVPGEEGSVRVIVNVEAQRDPHPGYDIVTRGIFYAARLLSSQQETEFAHSHYDQLKKVYSIWVCMGAPKAVAGSISAYSFTKRDLLGSQPDRPYAYDKAEVVVMMLGESENSGDKLMDMLALLTSEQVSRPDKLDGLRGRYNVEVTSEIEEGVNVMCNLGEYIAEKSLQQGIEQGRAQGIEQGRAQGIEQGRAQGGDRKLAELVGMNLRAGRSPEAIADFLGLTVEQVEEIAREQSTLA